MRNGASVVPGGFDLEFHEGLLVVNVKPQLGIQGDDGLVLF